MSEERCLYCYEPLPDRTTGYHSACSKNFFGTETLPILELSSEQMRDMAKDIVQRSIAVTGVQPKLSLSLEKTPGDPKKSRLTIVGLWGNFILKPPVAEFPWLPENEDLTMHLASHFGIITADHSLIRLQSGELAYITKRFDRVDNEKLALEDMCQLTGTLTSEKYRGSMEKIGRIIHQYATIPGLAALQFFELSLFCFLTGNADMHLKNFSLLTTREKDILFAPAYDLVNTRLAIPDDKEEMALTLNAKRRKITKKDFDKLAEGLKITVRASENVYEKFTRKIIEADGLIKKSFLNEEMRAAYANILMQNSKSLGLG